MKTEKELNLTDGWEDIINDPSRKNLQAQIAANQSAEKGDRLLNRALIIAAVACLFLALCFLGLMESLIAFPAAVALTGIACGYCGRAWEAFRG